MYAFSPPYLYYRASKRSRVKKCRENVERNFIIEHGPANRYPYTSCPSLRSYQAVLLSLRSFYSVSASSLEWEIDDGQTPLFAASRITAVFSLAIQAIIFLLIHIFYHCFHIVFPSTCCFHSHTNHTPTSAAARTPSDTLRLAIRSIALPFVRHGSRRNTAGEASGKNNNNNIIIINNNSDSNYLAAKAKKTSTYIRSRGWLLRLSGQAQEVRQEEAVLHPMSGVRQRLLWVQDCLDLEHWSGQQREIARIVLAHSKVQKGRPRSWR